ncbi:autotransporter domain-containing protein [Devosia sp. ZW T5_3]|uniref:autotransporter domain-containing protein n=1 Tax=Devosia sp. ZW T5_3 TaxID=3378085 RepID=UPI003852155C
MPPGLSVSSGGVLSGTPTALGTYNFVVRATDSTASGAGGPFSGTQSYSLTVGTPVAPVVTSVTVPANGIWTVTQTLDFIVNFDQAVTVTGGPSIVLTVGATGKQLSYVSGSGSNALRFSYVIEPGDLDSNGVTVGTLSLNGGTIRNATGSDAVLTLNSIGSTSGVLIDGNAIVAVDDSYSVQEDQQLVVSAANGVLANDTGANLVATLVVPPASGSFGLNADGSFTYTPAANFFGTDSFQVRVSNGAYTANSTATITVVPTTPVVSGVAPSQGPVTGGTAVTISGSDLFRATGVSFGGVPASFTVNSDTSLTATAPAGGVGAVDIVVSKGSVRATLAGGFTYVGPGGLSVADGGDFSASGPAGGPFAPASKTWTLSNGGGSDIDVLVSGPGGVFDIAGAADGVPFTLAAGGSTDITVSLNAGANGLTAGAVGGAVTFVNQTNGSGNTTRQVSLDVQAAALGSVTIRQETVGSDAVFGFRSATLGLNLSIATMGGSGQSADIALPAGRHSVVADDMSGAGYTLVGLVCSDSDSVGDVASRTASIVLDAGEAVICTFSAVNSAEATTALIEEFLDGRARQILANIPDEERRIARLNGVVSGGGSLGSTLLSYLPGVVEGGPVGVSTSLAAIDAMAGNQQPGALDVWFEGKFSLFEGGAGEKFSSAALGADYLLNPDLLIGGFVQFDFASRNFDSGAKASGTGWLAGPYLTARLSDNLYLDLLAAGGQSSNAISPSGSCEDDFDATRYLLSAALQGQWSHDAWTFSPRAQLSYFEETSDGYTDSLGVSIPAVTAGLGQLAVGPGIGYRLTLDNGVVVDLGLRAEAVLDIAGGSELGELQGRLSGSIGFGLVGGANIGLSARLDGIGSGEDRGSVGIRLSLPAR